MSSLAPVKTMIPVSFRACERPDVNLEFCGQPIFDFMTAREVTQFGAMIRGFLDHSAAAHFPSRPGEG